ncbi:M48 family metallopeptidase [Agathobaculum sp.]|uniref:M48 family metallopeptidase n=1 Tax=Agathobaculum sp. TaxID=2048138 RepID=UPI002A8321B3|nr:M48 family metallopeptidase [Agathobaculum sp.]MDY3618953.1 M48 family metallopeptidase [Agathobaculum sp.]
MTNYELIRSRRKTLALEVTREGHVLVRAPYRAPEQAICLFVEQHRKRLEKAVERQKQRRRTHPEPDEARQKEWIDSAKKILPERVSYYSNVMQLYPSGVRITAARTRFGSCSVKDRLCFSYRLMDYPQAAIDYVVVHELAHILHKNHGQQFWTLVESVLPDYRSRRELLR